MKLGELLRTAREQKNVSLREVEKATKIRTAYLEALEEENFHLLPGRIYVIGFLKSYAKFLGLSPEEVTGLYKSQYPSEEEEVPEKQLVKEIAADAGPVKRKFYLVGIIAIIFLIIVGIWYQGFWRSQPGQEPESPNGTDNQVQLNQPQPEEEPGVEEEGEQEQNIPEVYGPPLKLKIEIVEADCWVEIVVDGEVALSKTLSPGTVVDFAGEKQIQVKYGNAGAAKVTFNGEDYGFAGARNQVITKIYTVE